jgi:hypothetical protein
MRREPQAKTFTTEGTEDHRGFKFLISLLVGISAVGLGHIKRPNSSVILCVLCGKDFRLRLNCFGEGKELAESFGCLTADFFWR